MDLSIMTMDKLATDEKSSILIVDDQPENLLFFYHTLKANDREIIKVPSGKDALIEIEKQEFAVIILDVQMPEMDGFETAIEIRKSKLNSNTPIIFATAKRQEEAAVFQGYESGAVDYMFKPVEPLILRCKINIFLALYRQKKELEQKNRELQEALAHINTLRGIIPICMHCKKVRNDSGYWEQVEKYVKDHSGAEFTHGICPECLNRLFPDIAPDILKDPSVLNSSSGCSCGSRINHDT